MKFKLKRTFS